MSTELSPLRAQRPPVTPDVARPAPQPIASVAPEIVNAKPAVQDVQQKRANIREAVDRLNQQMQSSSRKLSFDIDEVADRVVITVKQSETGEVVRQIPDESLLRVAHNIEDIKGLLHNETT